MQMLHGLALAKLSLKNYKGNKNRLDILYFIKIDLYMPFHHLRLKYLSNKFVASTSVHAQEFEQELSLL